MNIDFIGFVQLQCEPPVHDSLCVSIVHVGLEEEGVGHFEVDSESGDIRTTELFARDAEPYYALKISARDSGAAPLEDAAVVHVQVQLPRFCLHFQETQFI